MTQSVPQNRIMVLNSASVLEANEFVLYWMIGNRRLEWNFALDRAIELANRLKKPLVILEALRCDYPWSCDRFHRFILQGMRDNKRLSSKYGVHYYGYVEPEIGKGRGLLYSLSRRACAVVTDYFPCFFLPDMTRKAARNINVQMEAVDSNGLYPLLDAQRDFTTAASFRRHLQKKIAPFLQQMPLANPLKTLHRRSKVDLDAILGKWAAADFAALLSTHGLSNLPIDHTVLPVRTTGGRTQGRVLIKRFIDNKLYRYHLGRNDIEDATVSGLSPYLHFGHVSAHEIWQEVRENQNWTEDKLPQKATGSRQGWWNMSEGAEAFLDQLITWRELGFVFCHRNISSYNEISSLPGWALKTISEHRQDTRPFCYSLAQLEGAQTHDELWNCSQRQLTREGTIHNYLRMLWGKKIYEWSPTADEALQRMVHLNNKYALDGRNPNSYSGIFWTMGRFDRAWGPERPIFGKLRYMSSESTARKLKLKNYLQRYAQAVPKTS